VVLARLGRYAEAIAAYQSALRLAPHLTPILLNLGIAHYRAGEFAQAVEAFDRLLARMPDSVQARQLRGLSLVELGRDAEAAAQLETTLASASEDAAVLYGLGLAYLRLRRAELRDMIERLAAFPAGAAASRMLKGQSLLVGLEFEKAVAELTAAQELNPELPRLNYSLGLCYFKLGLNKEAIAAFEEERKRRPRDLISLYYLAYLQEAEGNLTLAQQYLSPLLNAAREFAEVQRLKARHLESDRARTPKP
jgi:tetratricopeptide (TPR) repeat protein